MHDKATLTVLDYVVFSGMILLSFLIGIFTVVRAKRSADDFHTAGRSLSYLPVGFSLLTSYVSSISILGMSGDTYTSGIQLYVFAFGSVIGIYLTTFISLSVLSSLQITSTNEYIEMRFKSSRLRNLISFLTIIKTSLYMGICLYAPTIALAAVTPLDVHTYIWILGAVCTIYSSVGGIRAVVWTDVFQMFIMLSGIVVVVIIGCTDLGLGTIWSIGKSSGRTELFDMSFDPTKCTFWTSLIFGITFSCFVFGVHQMNLQRISSVPSEKEARKVLLITAIGMILVYALIFLSGLIVYAYYAGCDLLLMGYVEKKEEVLPYFVMDKLNFLYGFPGLFIAALFSGTLSSLSSAINGTVAIVWKDFLEKMTIFSKITPRMAHVVNIVLSMITGTSVIGVAFLFSHASGIIKYSFTIASVFIGPIYGVFLIGFLIPRCGTKGASIGLIVSLILMSWMSLGSLIYLPTPDHLPSSTELCNMTDTDDASYSMKILLIHDQLLAHNHNLTHSEIFFEQLPDNKYSIETEAPTEPYVFPLYQITYLYYPLIGPTVCVFVGVVVTLLGFSQNSQDVPKKFLSPFIRRYYS